MKCPHCDFELKEDDLIRGICPSCKKLFDLSMIDAKIQSEMKPASTRKAESGKQKTIQHLKHVQEKVLPPPKVQHQKTNNSVKRIDQEEEKELQEKQKREKEILQLKEGKGNKTRKILTFGIIFSIVLLLFYFCCGFFVIQPIGAIPKGATFSYFRFGRKMKFIESPDSLCLKTTGHVSLLGRGIALAEFSRNVDFRIKLPYFKILYLISTGFKEFEK